ncbi:MAG: flagellar brake protein [Gammaproteobacteria bacterium]|nr:flagellar brake protein [Gammaproteobacteria bacterium]
MVGLVIPEDPMELQQFTVDSSQSITTVFQQLMRKSEPVFLCNTDGEKAESRILNVDPSNGTMLLSHTSDYAFNKKIIEEGVYVVADHFTAQVQFFVNKLATVMFQQGHVFAISIPDEIYRIQRRESFRALIASENTLQCDIPVGTAGCLSMPLYDISRGGVSIVDKRASLPLKKGVVLQKCRLELPSIGQVEADLEVMSRFSYFDGEELHDAARIGCQFMTLSLGMENMLQRYIDHLEYRHRSTM